MDSARSSSARASDAPDGPSAPNAPAGRLSPLATPSATRAVLKRHGLFTKYGLGQNFLVNDDVIRKIIDLADIQPTDCVLEVGPGIGTLTAALLQRAAHVIAIEKDPDLPAALAETLAPWSSRFTLLQMDALDLGRAGKGPSSLPASQESSSGMFPPRKVGSEPGPFSALNKLVSNLPYAVAATIVLDYLQRFDFLESATVMVQKEVADRMMARPGTKAYGAYTVKLSLYAQPAGRFPVASGNFFPPPHVESTVLRLDRMPACDDAGCPLDAAELRAACQMADAAFSTRRKTLANSCKTYFAGQPDVQAALPRIFESAGIDPRRRGEALSRFEFICLGQALHAEAGEHLDSEYLRGGEKAR